MDPNYKELTKTKLTRPCIVISQPMYFPWPGMLEQIQLCDVFVDYNDAQFSKGSFSNRVQIKTEHGIRWLTVPLKNVRLGQLICDTEIDQAKNWQRAHLDQLKNAYRKAPFKRDVLDLVTQVFDQSHHYLGELSSASMNALLDYLPSIKTNTGFVDSSSLNVDGVSTERVINICAALEGCSYLTGHGARHYLNHEAFERQGMGVGYIEYGLQPYPQLHGAFTPYVSTLDLIANCGVEGNNFIGGAAIPWREFLSRLGHSKAANL